MKPRPPEPEPLMHLQASYNEVIAVNLAISYFLRYCKQVSPVYEEASQLLERFQRRIAEQQSETKHERKEPFHDQS